MLGYQDIAHIFTLFDKNIQYEIIARTSHEEKAMDTISVIIPVYNTCRELKRCLDSVCSQTYKNLEIILIDDGSNDGSEDIIDLFSRMDDRVIAIHKENGGESSARNIGLEKSTGNIISFVDCDDWIDCDMYEIMTRIMQDNNLDICACGWVKEFDNKSVEMSNILSVKNMIMNREQFLKKVYMRDSYQGFAYMWNKLYKRNILFDESDKLHKFCEDLSLGGDVEYLAYAALNSKRIKYIDRPFYHYYQRNNSGIHTLTTKKMRDWLRAYDLVLNMLMNESISAEIIDYVKRFMAYHASNGVKVAIDEGDVDSKVYFQTVMKKYKEEYFKLNIEYSERIEEFSYLLDM